MRKATEPIISTQVQHYTFRCHPAVSLSLDPLPKATRGYFSPAFMTPCLTMLACPRGVAPVGKGLPSAGIFPIAKVRLPRIASHWKHPCD